MITVDYPVADGQRYAKAQTYLQQGLKEIEEAGLTTSEKLVLQMVISVEAYCIEEGVSKVTYRTLLDKLRSNTR